MRSRRRVCRALVGQRQRRARATRGWVSQGISWGQDKAVWAAAGRVARQVVQKAFLGEQVRRAAQERRWYQVERQGRVVPGTRLRARRLKE
ncbi:MAG: hypothetical protein K6T31_09740 [Alicyclobacillus sp.]|nr:hypothetical protein [Alicyclobacillus sp.]